MVSISLGGVGPLGSALKSAKAMFSQAGTAMQSSIDKSMKSVRLMFDGFGKSASGAAGMAQGLATSFKGLNQAVSGITAAMAGNKGWGPVIDGLSGLRTAATGTGVTLRALGDTSSGLWAALRGGVGALSGISGAAMHASRALLSAAGPAVAAKFKSTFAAARAAASSFASGASAAMRSFTSSMGRAAAAVRSAASGMGSSFSGILSKLHPLRLAMAGIAATFAGGFLSAKWAADAEATQASFKTMLGGGDAGAAKAKALMGNVNKFAADTPFELPELTEATRKLLAFGSSDKGVMNDLQMMGDIASGIQAPIGEIAEIYGKARVQGRLFAEDINQLTGRGIPVISELAKQFGVSEAEVKKLVEQGKVGFAELEKAFQSMTAEGGKFHGMMADQSKTASGMWSTLMDNIKGIARELGGAAMPAIKAVMEAFIGMSGGASDWIDPLKDKINTFATGIASNMPGIIGWFKQAFVYVKAWGQTQVSIFGALFRIIGRVVSAVSSLVPSIQGYGDAFLKVHENLQFFFDNFETYLLLAWEHTKLFAANSYERIKTFFENIGVTLEWLGENWRSVFQTIWDFTKTAIENMGQNMAAFWQATRDWMAGKGFKFEWTGLLDGFESSISKMPALLTAQIRETTPELNRLYDELGRARRKYADDAKQEAKEGNYQLAGDVDKEEPKKSSPAAASGKIAFHGLVEFAKHIQGGAGTKERQAEDRDKKKTDAAQRTAKAAEKIAEDFARLHQAGLLIVP
ncbi:MAG TPA: tape measure protein [Pirellulales bacterium]|nr:tape measure protein [Pirellulales bacterium]